MHLHAAARAGEPVLRSAQPRAAFSLARRAASNLAGSPITTALLVSAKHAFLQRREPHQQVSNFATALVDLIICCISAFGSLTILVPYFFNRRSRKLRHSLIMGLATSDLISSLIIIATSAVLIEAGDLGLQNAPRFCTFAGYAFATVIWTEHLWNLSIAVVTYMLLVFPLSKFTVNIQQRLVWLWIIFWGSSLIANGIAWNHSGFADVGGYCSFDPTKGGSKFPATFLFVPRGIVFIVILVLYTHLFFFLRRTNLFHQVTRNSSRVSGSKGQAPDAESAFGQSRRGSQFDALDAFVEQQHAVPTTQKGRLGSTASTFFANVKRRFSAPGNVPSNADTPDGSSTLGDSKRTGSSSTQGKSSTVPQTLAFGDGPQEHDASSKSASPTTPTLQLPPQQPTTSFPGYGAPLTGVAALRRGSAPLPDAFTRRPSTTFLPIAEGGPEENRKPFVPTHKDAPAPPSILRDPRSSHLGRRDLAPHETVAGDDEDDDDEELPGMDLYRPARIRKDTRDFGMTSPPQEHLRQYSIKPSSKADAMLGKADGEMTEKSRDLDLQAILSETQDTSTHIAGSELQKTYDNVMSDDFTWGMAVGSYAPANQRGRNGGSGDAAASEKGADAIDPEKPQVLRQFHGRRRSKVPRWRRVLGQGRRSRQNSTSEAGLTSQASSYDENHVESMGSTLNRQASVLLLLYPAVYILTFSISIIRIIVDLTSDDTAEEARARQSDALHEISRWSIFAQGAIDALVFQFIERQFRNRMKRKRRIAAGEAVEDLWHVKIVKKMKSLGSRRQSSASQE